MRLEFKKAFKLVSGILFITIIWISFVWLTFSSEKLFTIIIPVIILLLQIFVPFIIDRKKLLLLVLFNPIVVLVTIYSIGSCINYFNGRPTEMKCTYNAQIEPKYDPEKNLYLEYMDDDCDFLGWHIYTIDINNGITKKLISVFGNPIKT